MGQEMIIFSDPQEFPVGQEMITFSVGSPCEAGNDHLFCPTGSPCEAGNDHLFCPRGTGPQDITTHLKHCNLHCFRLLPRTKQRYSRCFLVLEPQNRAKTLVFTLFSQEPKNDAKSKRRYLRHLGNTTCPKCCILQCFSNAFSKTLVFTAFCENTCTKHRKYQRIQRLHFPWQQATKSKNTDILQRFCAMIFPKTRSFWTIFGA